MERDGERRREGDEWKDKRSELPALVIFIQKFLTTTITCLKYILIVYVYYNIIYNVEALHVSNIYLWYMDVYNVIYNVEALTVGATFIIHTCTLSNELWEGFMLSYIERRVSER